MNFPINPYDNYENSSFWSKNISNKPLGSIDITQELEKFTLTPHDKVMSIGSCFAQHISNFLQSKNYNYLLYEKNYRQFSAKYGNIYTVEQGKQLLERAINKDPEGEVWINYELKKYIDSFRPRIFDKGFSTVEEVKSERITHLESTINAFKDCDVLIYTLGLTEGWKSKNTGQVFQIAPGVDGGSFDSLLHEPFNSSLSDVVNNLQSFISQIRLINPKVKILITVSPVHLAATHTKTNVLLASIESKMKLRLATTEILKQNNGVYYFPSLEYIFTLSQTGSLYGNNRRDVSELGVKLVMNMFAKTYLGEAIYEGHHDYTKQDILNREVICDEDVLLRQDS
jgi:hypothetical protein